jgi:hypothetical protein
MVSFMPQLLCLHYALDRRMGRPQTQSELCEVRKNLLPLTRIKPFIVSSSLHQLSYSGPSTTVGYLLRQNSQYRGTQYILYWAFAKLHLYLTVLGTATSEACKFQLVDWQGLYFSTEYSLFSSMRCEQTVSRPNLFLYSNSYRVTH